jgi:hypothetical protein
MQIDMKNTMTERQLRWILAKFLKDSLDFLSDNPRAKGMKRMDWIEEWMKTNGI